MRQVWTADTETTGFDHQTNSLVEFAAVTEDRQVWAHSLLKPKHPISFGAMATHHITEDMVADAPEAEGWLDTVFFRGDGYGLVFHNAGFDTNFLPLWMREWPVVCTWRCAMHLFPDAESHSNQSLRYELGLDVSDMPAEAGGLAHRALYDAWVTSHLYQRIREVSGLDFDGLAELTKKPVLLKKVRFGKHVGELWEDVPKSYLRWMLGQDFDEDTMHTARYYLG